jgi:hypothetical protein
MNMGEKRGQISDKIKIRKENQERGARNGLPERRVPSRRGLRAMAHGGLPIRRNLKGNRRERR